MRGFFLLDQSRLFEGDKDLLDSTKLSFLRSVKDWMESMKLNSAYRNDSKWTKQITRQSQAVDLRTFTVLLRLINNDYVTKTIFTNFRQE